MNRIIVITMVLLAFSFVLLAKKPGMKPMGGGCRDCNMHEMKMGPHPDMGMEILKKLDLTKDQKKKLEAIRDEHKKLMNLKKAELKNLLIDKQNAIQAEDFTKAKQLNKNVADKELEIANLTVDLKQDMLKELTPEQKEKLRNMLPMMKEMMKEKMKGKMKERCEMEEGKGHKCDKSGSCDDD
ncbi:MAG: hypothetical protein FJ041_04710 [Candidatus Cloacimonetes bacterium]|nr:hypothetical protein [Candidatus Cloacimonadota bacterium]